ncbi:hypothetical protein [Cohnella candidum]|uniref:Uncharacterized protein n=1 Tax=Cohnella candidum TaxID=2674991 RepID=A0A3G3K2S1_9BACL|nr:hypothetical protein [Cohnella candidum]AYQ74758.1 hypothetical protein EAV92_20710 [Cohnella candidum]
MIQLFDNTPKLLKWTEILFIIFVIYTCLFLLYKTLKSKIKINFYYIAGLGLIFIIIVSLYANVYYANENWIGYWGNIAGGVIGGFVTFLGIRYTLDSVQKQERNKNFSIWVPFDTIWSTNSAAIVPKIIKELTHEVPSEQINFELILSYLNEMKQWLDESFKKYGDVVREQNPLLFHILESKSFEIKKECNEYIELINSIKEQDEMSQTDRNILQALAMSLYNSFIKVRNEIIEKIDGM